MAITLRDIAKRTGVSHATVSFALNHRMDVNIPDSTRQRIIDAAAEMGYRPNRAARALMRGKTQQIALWMPSPRNPYYGSVFDTVFSALREREHDIAFAPADYTSPTPFPSDWPVDGLIAWDTGPLLERETPPSMPIVSVGALVDERFDTVRTDLRVGTWAALDHLRDIGCKRVAHLLSMQSAPPRNDPRTDAFCTEMERRGIEPEMIVAGNPNPATIVTAVTAHIERFGAPDAIFCRSDMIALPCLTAIRKAGLRVPEDIAVIGFDGLEFLDYSNPSLTSIEQPVEQIAKIAVERLFARMADNTIPVWSELVTPKLVIRESTSRA
ncbi:LacI family transcriptional regulator [bacterium]|nr:MAG: LacI family transcriptional regulator [bacterium]